MTDSCNPDSTPPSLLDPAGDRFGEVLSRIVPLSRHDVYEILEEQAQSHKRFGQIAIQLGMCEPVHVWQAWSAQLLGRTPRVDLDKFGVDAQAAEEVPAWLAAAVGVVPIRSTEHCLVIAATDRSLPRATELLTAQTTKPVSFVLADAGQVEEAIRRYYTMLPGVDPAPAAASSPQGSPPCRCGQRRRGHACPGKCRPISMQADATAPDMTYA